MLDVPFDDRDGWIWLDGKIVPWREAQIHCLSHGLHYASAVFEGERAYGGKIFKSQQHTKRFFRSAAALRLKIGFSEDEIISVKNEILKLNNLQDAYVRPFAFRGPEETSVAGFKTKTHVGVAAWYWPSYFSPEQHARGLKLGMSKWRRAAPDMLPTTAKASAIYSVSTIARHDAAEDGFDDAVMLDYQGNVAEASAANIFFVKGGELHTPNPDSFLNGITRQTAIELAERRGIKVHVRYIRPDELGSFDACFLTGTAVEITAVGQIAEHTYPVGEMVKQLAEDYRNEVRR
jgi:branched-chain amino acid aminotransferase